MTRTRDDGGGTADVLPPDHTQAILEVTKEVGSVLKGSGCPFALVGSVAAYAYGIPVRLQHDADFALRAEDADTVVELLRERGVQIVEPPEDWLVKARSGGEQIDLIFALAGRAVTRELLDRAWILPVDSVHLPVIDPTDLMIGRLAALSEHHCDYGALLPVARGLRERVDWDRVAEETHDLPMAAAFLYLLRLLGVLPHTPQTGGDPARVRRPEEQRTEEQRTEEQRTEEQRTEEQRTEEQRMEGRRPGEEANDHD
ncbi:nucleotidyltransferase family protein [Streptomyces sp. CC208A]|uniref:nucleotidyltransferase family protein n=1 Tax=Streptomyces sp. CC208A TaxID=3044573 RepID=UPI0024A7AF7F|nr:nucleotidyltransferase family protein [Streptomyces sp. CC208A]